MANVPYTVKEVLSQVDQFAEIYGVPFFDDGGCYIIECRLSCYRDDEHWGVTLEDLVFGPRGKGHQGIAVNIYSYGNCLRVKAGGNNLHQFRFTSDGPEGPTFAFSDPPCDDLETWEYVHPEARTMRIRDQVVPIETDPKAYEEMGISLLDPPRIKGHELLRGLPLRHRKMLLCTEQERLKKFLVKCRPPMILQLDEWYHPKLSEGEIPSQTETFQMLAEALVTGDPARYRPTKVPNTHWSNWPKAGMFDRPVGW
jgi:hypothetical protein